MENNRKSIKIEHVILIKKNPLVQFKSIQYRQTAGEQQYTVKNIVVSACCPSQRPI